LDHTIELLLNREYANSTDGIMTTQGKTSAKRDPWFGVFSVTTPFIGFFSPLAAVFGIGFAIAALIRREKQPALGWYGLILNIGCLVLFARDIYCD